MKAQLASVRTILGKVSLGDAVDGPDEGLRGSLVAERADWLRIWAPDDKPGTRDACIRTPSLILAGELFSGGAPARTEEKPSPDAVPKELHFSGALVEISEDPEGTRCLRVHCDKYGLRPLFYAQGKNVLWFANLLELLERHGRYDRSSLSEDDLLHLYHFGYSRNDHAIVAGIRKLPPGHTLTVRNGKLSIEPYFTVSDLYRPERLAGLSEDEICDLIEQSLVDSVGRRIATNSVPAVALSGGVDSGLVAHSLSTLGQEVKAYTLIYRDRYSEADRVKQLSRRIGIDVSWLEVDPEDVLEHFRQANRECSEPAGFNMAIMRAVVAASARDSVSILLDGDGADRQFLGMNRYRDYARLFGIYETLKRGGLARPAGFFATIAPWREARKAGRLFRTWNSGLRPYPERALDSAAPFDLDHERELFEIAVRRFARAFEATLPESDFGLFFSYMSIHLCPEMFFHRPAELALAQGLATAPPFWDDELVSLAISLPTALKLRGGTTKYILRRTAARRLGKDYAFLPKIGLQSAWAFLADSPAGRSWRDGMVERVKTSEAYHLLRKRLPGGVVQPERLIPLVEWQNQ